LEEILDQHLEKSISKAATLDLKLDENFSKMEILEGNMGKLLKRALNLDLKLYRSLCLVDLTSKMLTEKADILSQKDYVRPLKIDIPEYKPFRIDKDILGPIRHNYDNFDKLDHIKQPEIFQADPKVNCSLRDIFYDQTNSSFIGPIRPQNFQSTYGPMFNLIDDDMIKAQNLHMEAPTGFDPFYTSRASS